MGDVRRKQQQTDGFPAKQDFRMGVVDRPIFYLYQLQLVESDHSRWCGIRSSSDVAFLEQRSIQDRRTLMSPNAHGLIQTRHPGRNKNFGHSLIERDNQLSHFMDLVLK